MALCSGGFDVVLDPAATLCPDAALRHAGSARRATAPTSADPPRRHWITA